MMDKELFFIITSIIFIILTLITIIFSLTIIIIIIQNWKSRCRSITNLLTCNSCFTLFYHSIATTIEIVFIITNHYREKTNITPTLCKISAFVYFSSCTAIAYSYAVQAISRYFIIILYKYKILLTFHVNYILIVINWIISGVLPAFMFISSIAFQYEHESRMCLLTSKVFSSSFIGVMIAFYIPLNIVILLYSLILRHTMSHEIHSNSFTTLRLKRNLKVFQNILIFVTILGLGGIPYFISVIINRINRTSGILYSLSILFISLSAALESLALFFTNTEVKRLCYAMIRCHQRENSNSIMMINTQIISHIDDMNDIPLISTNNESNMNLIDRGNI